MYLRNLLLVLILALSSACASKTTVRHSSDFQSVISQSNREVLIMPPVAEVNMVDISNKKSRMYDYEYHLEDIIYQELIPVLQEQGLRPRVLHRKELHDQGLAPDAARMRDRYNEASEQLYKVILWDKEKAYNISENVGTFAAPIALRNHGELIVMVDYARDVKTSGARTRDVMMDIFLNTNHSADADKSVMVIAIIDAKNNKIIWTNMSMSMRDVIGAAMDNRDSEDKLAAQKIKAMLTTMFTNFFDEEKK